MTLENSKWWLHLLGVDTEGIPADAEVEPIWLNLPQSWQWWIVFAIAIAGGYAVFWLYRREIDTCPRWAKMLLATLRTCALLLLMVIVFQPALVHTKRTELKPSLFLVRDASHSMQFQDAYLADEVAVHAANALGTSVEEVRSLRPNRVEVLQASLQKDDWKLVEQLQRRGKLHVVNFANTTEIVETRPPLSDLQRQAEEKRRQDPGVMQASLERARFLAAIAGGLVLAAAIFGFAAWYSSSLSMTWILGLIAAAGVLGAIVVAGINAVQNPEIEIAQIFTGLDEAATAKADEEPPDAASLEEIRPLPPLEADGQGSDLYEALAAALGERHTATAIVFTDGQHTSREHSRDDLIAIAAQEDKPVEERVPVFFVGVGDPNKPRNLAVSDVYADPQVFPEEPFEVRAVVRGQDIGQRAVRVDLIRQRLNDEGAPAGEPQVVESRSGEVIPASGKLDLIFKVDAGEPGLYGYSVRVETVENESNEDDNEPASPTVVKVLDDQARVLLVAGAPTWEYRMVQRLLTREDSVDLSCWLQTLDENRAQEGNTVITRLPVDRKELFEYDVVMLFDPDPIEFDPAWVELLKEFVGDHAGGLLYMAGPKFSGRFLGAARTRMMRDVLPVQLGDVGAMEVQNLLESNTRSWPLGIVSSNVDLPIMRFESDPLDSLNRWNAMPGIYWSFPSEGAKPAARVLIEHSAPEMRSLSGSGSRPLLVAGQYGSGRTIYMGFNGTWRWRKVGHNAEYFKRFWVQTTRYLIEGRSLEGRRRGYVEANKARYQLGDKVEITARELKDENFNLYAMKEIPVVIMPEGEQPITTSMKKVPNQDGVYQTTYTAKSTGRHVVKVQMPAATGEPPQVETSYDVTLPTVETNEVALNKSLLVDLASASGGAYFEVDQIDQIPARIPEKVRHSEFPDKPRLLWDTNRLLLLLVGLLSIEWAMRKGFKLL